MADNNKKYKGLILIAILIALAAFSSSSALSGMTNFTINVSGYSGQPRQTGLNKGNRDAKRTFN